MEQQKERQGSDALNIRRGGDFSRCCSVEKKKPVEASDQAKQAKRPMQAQNTRQEIAPEVIETPPVKAENTQKEMIAQIEKSQANDPEKDVEAQIKQILMDNAGDDATGLAKKLKQKLLAEKLKQKFDTVVAGRSMTKERLRAMTVDFVQVMVDQIFWKFLCPSAEGENDRKTLLENDRKTLLEEARTAFGAELELLFDSELVSATVRHIFMCTHETKQRDAMIAKAKQELGGKLPTLFNEAVGKEENLAALNAELTKLLVNRKRTATILYNSNELRVGIKIECVRAAIEKMKQEYPEEVAAGERL